MDSSQFNDHQPQEEEHMKDDGHTLELENIPAEMEIEISEHVEKVPQDDILADHHDECSLAAHPKKETESDHQLAKMLAELKEMSDPEAKLQKAIDFMAFSLAQSGSPSFKNFWEMRKQCLEFFKENIAASARSSLWTKYSELSKEARRLKEILDEQSAFAVEQIEIAITALESDISNFMQQVEKIAPLEFPLPSETLKIKFEKYDFLQRQLNLLNTFASRINVLRKELIKTEMRVRQKNKFFQRLSTAGDHVFPKRKELIKEVSQLFIQDVDSFINANFCNEDVSESLYLLREEIKALQCIAKVLTLNTHSFTHTRTRLSTCWDRVKHLEKERKKERAQQKVIFKENMSSFITDIETFKSTFEAGELNTNAANQRLDDISHRMRDCELGRDEVRHLREELGKARKLIQDKLKNEEQVRQDQERERSKQRRQKIDQIRADIENLIKSADSYEVDQFATERDNLLNAINTTAMIKTEKQELERLLKPIKDLISEKREKSLMNLSDDDKQTLSQLKEILTQRKERRQEIKTQIEVYRKASGNSGFDFEQAMEYNQLLNAEKERLEKINAGIKEVEAKIAELQKKV